MRRVRRLVVKVGTSTLTAGGLTLNSDRLDDLTRQLVMLHRRSIEVTLVTSGAIVTGAARLRVAPGKRSIPERQALAAIGQAVLMHEYERRFAHDNVIVAQMLLTAGDFDQRQAYLNARHTVEELLGHRVLPIVNENDTVATEEIRIGDNDTLSARVAVLVNAQLLCILSDVDGLYTADPHADPAAARLQTVEHVTREVEVLAGRARSPTGVGGMVTKLAAARLAASAGVAVTLTNGAVPNVLLRVLQGEALGTRFLPEDSPLRGRRRWLAMRTRVYGRLQIDAGAAAALQSGGRSLLLSGIQQVEGEFAAGDMIVIVGPDGRELGQGLAAYDCGDLNRIKGRRSQDATTILGGPASPAVQSDDLVIYR